MTQETKIGLAINQGAMLRNLRFSFANRDTVVQELVQNARRAGALSVDIVYQPSSGARNRGWLRSDNAAGTGAAVMLAIKSGRLPKIGRITAKIHAWITGVA